MMIKHINEYFNNGKTIAIGSAGRQRKRGERSASVRLKNRPCDDFAKKGSFVYFVIGGSSAVKVGRTTNLTHRLCNIQNGNAETVRLSGVLDVPSLSDAKTIEGFIHQKLKAAGRHISGEWFRLAQGEIENICRQCEQLFVGKASVHFLAAILDEPKPINDNDTFVAGNGVTRRNLGLR